RRPGGKWRGGTRQESLWAIYGVVGKWSASVPFEGHCPTIPLYVHQYPRAAGLRMTLVTRSFKRASSPRSGDHNWLVESALPRESPTDICESARLQNAGDLIAQDRSIRRRPVEVIPTSRCFPRDVHVKGVPAFVLP